MNHSTSQYQVGMGEVFGKVAHIKAQAGGREALKPEHQQKRTENDLWRDAVKIYRKYHAPLIAAAKAPKNPADPGAEAVAIFDAALADINTSFYGENTPLGEWFSEIYGVLDEEYKRARLETQQDLPQI